MKKFFNCCLILVFAFTSNNLNAQFLKKLKQKVEDKVEQVATEKISNKAAEKAGNSLDKILDFKFKENAPIPIGLETVSFDEIPAEYNFEWIYALKMESSQVKDAMNIDYYLKKDASYWGAKMNQEMELFMVYDFSNNLSVIFMKNDGNNLVSATKINNTEIVEGASDVNFEMEDYKITEIEGKKILGYNCKGYVIENNEYKFTMFTTFDAPVNFADVYGKSKQIPKNFNLNWLSDGDNTGLLMEMLMEDKQNSKNNFKMECVNLEKKTFSISKSEYKSMAY